jgi:DNA-binding NarL/FixJ family response regulator
LTEREKDVAALVCLGYTNHEIADQLGVSSETIKSHMSHVLTKMEVPTRYTLQQKLGIGISVRGINLSRNKSPIC